jgi:hypothetical protein
MLTIAEMPLDSIIPSMSTVSISLTFTEMNIISIITAPAPSHEAPTSAQLPRPERYPEFKEEEKPSITNATPRLAPELMPRTYGPAIGFLKSVCICNPLTERAIPTIAAVRAFGILNFITIVAASELSPRKIAPNTSDGLRLTDPSMISRANATMKRTPRMIYSSLISTPVEEEI